MAVGLLILRLVFGMTMAAHGLRSSSVGLAAGALRAPRY